MAPKRRQCAAMQEYERLLEEQPSFRTNQQRAEAFTARAVTSGEADRVARKLITIPTVVHVVYKKPQENISKAQIQSQIDRPEPGLPGHEPRHLQGARRRGRASSPTRRSSSSSPRRTPTASRTDGIVRVQTDRTSFGAGDGVKRASKGGSSAWPTDAYLNIWVCTLGGGLLGYAQFPGGPKATDGVVILNTAFGTEGTASAPFDKGRTLTHEVGHWLNLRHIWGDTLDCSGGDRVAGHAELRGTQHRQADLPGDHVQQRAQRRHVHELHGLRRRRGDVHVHRRAGGADERLPGRSAQVVRRGVAAR